MTVGKKIAFAVGGAIVAAGIFFAVQYKRLMNYEIKVKGGKIKKISIDRMVLDIFLDFNNRSSLKIVIKSQEYNVFINNSFVANLKSKTETTILPKSSSVIPLIVDFSPKKAANVLGKNLSDIALSPESVMLKIEIRLMVSFYGMSLAIPYTFESSLKNLKKGNG